MTETSRGLSWKVDSDPQIRARAETWLNGALNRWSGDLSGAAQGDFGLVSGRRPSVRRGWGGRATSYSLKPWR